MMEIESNFINYSAKKDILLQFPLLLSLCLPLHLHSAPLENITEESIRELQAIDKQTWEAIGLNQLFDPELLPPSEQIPLIQEEKEKDNRSIVTRACFHFAKWSKKSGCDGFLWCWCWCISIPLSYAFPELDYGKFCRECAYDCFPGACFHQKTTSESQPIETPPPANFTPWLENPQINHALMISNPAFYQDLQLTPMQAQTSHRITHKTSEIKHAVRPLSESQVALLKLIERYGLAITHIEPDNNCFRNVFLPEALRYSQEAVNEMIRHLDIILTLAMLFHSGNQNAQEWNVLFKNLDYELSLSFIYGLPEKLIIEEVIHFIANIQNYISIKDIDEISRTNANQQHADISLALFMPLITGQPVLVIQPDGSSEVGLYIVDQTGHLHNIDSEDFPRLLNQSTPVIHNGANHYLTAEHSR